MTTAQTLPAALPTALASTPAQTLGSVGLTQASSLTFVLPALLGTMPQENYVTLSASKVTQPIFLIPGMLAAVSILNNVFSIALSDGTATSEAISRLLFSGRTLSETIQSSETILDVYNAIRHTLDSNSISDSISRFYHRMANLSEIITTSDIANRLFTAYRLPADTITTSDIFTQRLGTLVRPIVENILTSEFSTRFHLYTAFIAESIISSDAMSRLLSSFRLPTDTISTLDTVTNRIISYLRSPVDSVLTSDHPAFYRAHFFTIMESAITNDAVSRIINGFRSATDVLQISDIQSVFKGYPRFIADTVTILDNIGVRRLYYRLLGDTIALGDIANRLANMSFSFDDTLPDITDGPEDYGQNTNESPGDFIFDDVMPVVSAFATDSDTGITGFITRFYHIFEDSIFQFIQDNMSFIVGRQWFFGDFDAPVDTAQELPGEVEPGYTMPNEDLT